MQARDPNGFRAPGLQAPWQNIPGSTGLQGPPFWTEVVKLSLLSLFPPVCRENFPLDLHDLVVNLFYDWQLYVSKPFTP